MLNLGKGIQIRYVIRYINWPCDLSDGYELDVLCEWARYLDML